MKKILLIEDNLDMRENTAEILELANYDVVTAENGKIGVELARENIPDLIICDIMMPELDGYGVLYLLGKNADTASIPFIFLTAKAEKSDFRKGMNLGADDYLTKPFEEMELLNAIESRLKRSESIQSQTFDGNLDSLHNFIDEARGVEELKSLANDRKIRNYNKKDILFREGDLPNQVYFINKGKVKTFRINDDGKEYITGLFKEGEFIGYASIIEGEDYADTAMALEDTEVATIPRNDFVDLIQQNKDVSARFIKMLANDIKEREQQLINLAYNSVRKRAADALVLLMDRYQEEHEDNFTMAISRDDLASIVGTATESVIRSLSDFKDEGLIEIHASKITILEPEKLRSLRH